MYINVQTLQFVSQHVENYFSFLRKRVLLCRLKFIGLFQACLWSKKCDCFIIPQTQQCIGVQNAKKHILFIHLFLQCFSLSDSGNTSDIFVLLGEKSCMISAATTPFIW